MNKLPTMSKIINTTLIFAKTGNFQISDAENITGFQTMEQTSTVFFENGKKQDTIAVNSGLVTLKKSEKIISNPVFTNLWIPARIINLLSIGDSYSDF